MQQGMINAMAPRLRDLRNDVTRQVDAMQGQYDNINDRLDALVTSYDTLETNVGNISG